MNVREPTVAGQFYQANPKKLISELDGIYNREKSRIQIDLAEKEQIGGVVPHAGYVFSASHAMHYFKILQQSKKETDTFVIINPNHTGLGDAIALDENDAWHTPFGNVAIDTEFNRQLGYPLNSASHSREHSGEVMLPLIQYFFNHDFSIVPIAMADQSYHAAYELANSIMNTAEALNRKITIIASSDFSHFVSQETGRKMDDKVLEQIRNMDVQRVEQEIKKHNISVCGYGPIMTLMEYAGRLSKQPKARILSRGSSGDVIPSDEVVDYVSILITKS